MLKLTIALFLAGAELLAQIPVAGGGRALMNAVASAPAGAVLVVAPGSYYPFSATGHLTIVAPQRATIAYAPASPGPLRTTVVGVSAALPLRIVGLDFVGAAVPGGQGEVQCTDVHLEDCTAENVRVYGGTFSMADCTVVAQTEAALFALNAKLTLSDSSFSGGFGSDPYSGAWAEAAIRLQGSVLRAERIEALSGASGLLGTALALYTSYPSGEASSATVADSVLLTAAVPGSWSVDCMTMNTVKLSNTSTPGHIACAHTIESLATLRWLTKQWTPGGASTLRSHHLPSTVATLVISLDVVPFASPLITDLSFVGGTSNWWFHAYGVSDAFGEADWTVALPPVPALQYASAWLHAVSAPGLPLNVSAPLGGLVR